MEAATNARTTEGGEILAKKNTVGDEKPCALFWALRPKKTEIEKARVNADADGSDGWDCNLGSKGSKQGGVGGAEEGNCTTKR